MYLNKNSSVSKWKISIFIFYLFFKLLNLLWTQVRKTAAFISHSGSILQWIKNDSATIKHKFSQFFTQKKQAGFGFLYFEINVQKYKNCKHDFLIYKLDVHGLGLLFHARYEYKNSPPLLSADYIATLRQLAWVWIPVRASRFSGFLYMCVTVCCNVHA